MGVQQNLIEDIVKAKSGQKEAQNILRQALTKFSNLIDKRGDEELPEVDPFEENNDTAEE